MTDSKWTRRRLLAGGTVAGLAGLGGAGAIGYTWQHPAATAGGQAPTDAPTGPVAAQRATNVHAFITRSDLHPPRLPVVALGSAAGLPGYMFIGNKPFTTDPVGQNGLLIAQRDGDIAWFSPVKPGTGEVWNFNTQSYKGKPVLTWWHGQTGRSHGNGYCYIADSSYSPVATVRARNGLMADGHEFNLTDQGTALIDAFKTHRADLRSVGGKANGWAESGVVQEIDIATGDLVFQWDSMDHVPVSETYIKYTGATEKVPFSYFHINSIAVAWDGDLLVSSRHTWTVYKIGRHDGKIRWRLGGKKSDFTFGPGANFYWQHHARAHGTDLLTVFDNGAPPPEEPSSRGLLLRLDFKRMHATLERAFPAPGGLLAGSQGSVQLLPGNRAFVGWGSQPFFSEFEADGSMLLNGHLPLGNQSYRTFTADWTGHPTDRPAIAVEPNKAGGTAVYASWNGATEVVAWRVLAGKHPSSLRTLTTLPRCGFETLIAVDSAVGDSGPYFAVTAHDASGNMLGQSATVRSH